MILAAYEALIILLKPASCGIKFAATASVDILRASYTSIQFFMQRQHLSTDEWTEVNILIPTVAH